MGMPLMQILPSAPGSASWMGSSQRGAPKTPAPRQATPALAGAPLLLFCMHDLPTSSKGFPAS
jgi:hypothetical protein